MGFRIRGWAQGVACLWGIGIAGGGAFAQEASPQPLPQPLPGPEASLVRVLADPTCEASPYGSGVVVAPGVVATNAHVVQGGTRVTLQAGSRIYVAMAHIFAPELDLCLLKVPGLDLPPVRLAIDPPVPGASLQVLGFPRSPHAELHVPLTQGGVQAHPLYRSTGRLTHLWRYRGAHLLQTDALTRPGNSGGGVFGEDGRLVGISSFIFQSLPDASFALPAAWIPELMERSWVLGMSLSLCKPREVLLHELLDRLTEAPENRAPWEAFARSWIQTRPLDPEAWYSLGHALFLRLKGGGTQGDPGLGQAAQAAFRKAVELSPGHARAWNNLGVVLDNLGQPEKAVEAFSMALRLRPDYALAWINQGIAQFNHADWVAAGRSLRSGLALLPDHAQAWGLLAYCEGQQGRWEAALQAQRVALRHRPLHAPWWADFLRLHKKARLPLKPVYEELEAYPDLANQVRLELAQEP